MKKWNTLRRLIFELSVMELSGLLPMAQITDFDHPLQEDKIKFRFYTTHG